ncbi:MAG: cytochrome c family protein [bacterium]
MRYVLWVLLLASVTSDSVHAQKASAPKKPFKYGGVLACKPCHLSVKSGAQFKIWQRGPHAKAFETLGSSGALKVAQALGIEAPQESDKCLRCHVTAHGVKDEFRGKRLTLQEGVSCEACHGPGSEYQGRKLMQAIYQGKVDGTVYGLVPQSEKVCITCHNPESPTYKKFKYNLMAGKIAHPIPLQSSK